MDVRIIGTIGPSKDRVIALSGVTTAQDINYPAGQEPTTIIIGCKGGATDVMKVCINASTTAVRDEWLGQVGDANTNLMHRRILASDPVEKRTITVAPGSKITKVSYLPVAGHTEIEVLGG